MDQQLPIPTFDPAFDRLFVIRDETQDQTSGGVYIPETEKEKPNKGIVIAVGADCKFAFRGQRIVFGQHHGVDIYLDGMEITILRENDIYAGDRKPPMSTEMRDKMMRMYNEQPTQFIKND